jgi:hypothetical protein
METRRWTNPSQPQTLYLAQFLLYFTAAFALLGLVLGGGLGPIGLLVAGGGAAGAYGIANEKKWGYGLAVAVAVVVVGFQALLLLGDFSLLANISFLINAMFDVALAVLLLHPQSRDYQKVWFR